ncbi:MAG: glycosyltransferase [Armatimonadota bacterium]|nr:glycosyltransferase [Armatimonadota bacterium]
MKVSVIVPTWSVNVGLRTMAERNLRAVRDRSRCSPELIVVDNGSPCGPPLVAVDLLIGWASNRGIAPAWNIGAHYAAGDVLIFVNSDCEVQDGWDEPLARCALSGAHVAFPETSGTLEIAGWCFAVSRETFRRVGPFDESFVPAFYEDTDWFQRAVDAGVRLLGVRASRVRHQRRTTVSSSPWAARTLWLFLSQRLRFSWKHGLDPERPPAFWARPLEEWDGGLCLQCGEGGHVGGDPGDDGAGGGDGAPGGGGRGGAPGHP